jgi:hypothetical protein
MLSPLNPVPIRKEAEQTPELMWTYIIIFLIKWNNKLRVGQLNN